MIGGVILPYRFSLVRDETNPYLGNEKCKRVGLMLSQVE